MLSWVSLLIQICYLFPLKYNVGMSMNIGDQTWVQILKYSVILSIVLPVPKKGMLTLPTSHGFRKIQKENAYKAVCTVPGP